MKSVQLSSVSLSFGGRKILEEITLTLTRESRAALAGGNGSGKSTLMQIVAGLRAADEGTISSSPRTRVSYLPQSGRVFAGRSLREEADTAFSAMHRIHEEKGEIDLLLGESESHNERVDALLQRRHDLEEELLSGGYYHREAEIDKVLIGLGFSREDFERDCEVFSGGWQMRIALAKVLLAHPDILLLDEPTNYLDYEARTWLEVFLSTYRGGFLIVSHDRYFLDVTVREVYELFLGKLKRYTGNYHDYRKTRDREIEELKKRYAEQQEEIARTEAFIAKFRFNAAKAAQVQSRVKQLEKLERIELPVHMKGMGFRFPPAPHSGKMVLSLDGLQKTYGNNTVLEHLSFELRRGDRMVVTGMNGAGKSTLLRIIAGKDEEYQGSVKTGTGVRIGYFSQEQKEFENSGLAVIETMERECPTERIPELRSLLGAFLFQGDDIYKPVQVLSGGEMSRLALLRLMLQPYNLLILDEPTNHLDIHSKEVLLRAIEQYEGSLVFVSHDRYFIESLATRVLELGPNGPKEYSGDFSYYLHRKKQETSPIPTRPPARRSPAEGEAKNDYREEKRRKNRLRIIKKEEEELMGRIEGLEREHTEIEHSMTDPEVYTDGRRVKKLQEELKDNTRQQEEYARRWEGLEEERRQLLEEVTDES
jgi:ATP-binding cassette, subfamily F, member 3